MGLNGTNSFPISFNTRVNSITACCITHGDIIQILSVNKNNFSYIIYDRLLQQELYQRFYWIVIGT